MAEKLMKYAIKALRLLTSIILLAWIGGLLFAIYNIWSNGLPLSQTQAEVMGVNLRKIALAFCWGAVGTWIHTFQTFIGYLRAVDEKGEVRSHWCFLFTHPLLQPVLGGITAVAFVLIFLGATDDLRISGISILAGLFLYDIWEALKGMLGLPRISAKE